MDAKQKAAIQKATQELELAIARTLTDFRLTIRRKYGLTHPIDLGVLGGAAMSTGIAFLLGAADVPISVARAIDKEAKALIKQRIDELDPG